ncbi:tellurium resistance protein terz-like [Gigaspora margarita]|uniref:Tellurium resistance protein terz-like n=1 Tax=Gigaspora margarita TaxID=4874 RepID=A0A8H4ARR5_GIGMA|nr:tellurium resistance protein terz-like [Gigaspora margarita]
MKCSKCRLKRLSKEFPLKAVSHLCKHIPTWCLECVIAYLEDKTESNDLVRPGCPECNVILTQKEVDYLTSFWKQASFKLNIPDFSREEVIEVANETGEFYVVLLNGQKYTFRLEETKSVRTLKIALMKKTAIESRMQKLVFKGVELNEIDKSIVSYGIHAGCQIQLVVILDSITKEVSIDNLVFDLHWGFPITGCDFLDGTCLIYAGKSLWRKYDYRSTSYPDINYIRHSGDIMDSTNQRGHHRFTINLNQLPKEVSTLYFVLSTYDYPNIGNFVNPSFQLYFENSPQEHLNNYSIQTTANAQAVIMSYVARSFERWEVIEAGILSDGNVNNYGPIERRILDLEQNMM